MHFVLFVRACVEVDRRRKDRRTQQVILAMIASGQAPAGLAFPAYDQAYTWSHAEGSARKSSHTAPPLSEMESTVTPVEMNADRDARELVAESAHREEMEVNTTYPKEIPMAPEDAGMSEKVLIDDNIRKARAHHRTWT